MKGTRLWKPAGSPLIQGRSRRERPFVTDWVSGSIVSLVTGGGVMVSFLTYQGSGFDSALRTVWIPAIPAAALGSAIGVWLGRRLGWHPRWVSGAVAGIILVAAATASFVAFLASRLGG